MPKTTINAQGMPRKPLIFAANPFDDTNLDSLEFVDNNWDASYVPGYSELKKDNEIREAKHKKRIDSPRLQWVRISRYGSGDVSASDEGMIEG